MSHTIIANQRSFLKNLSLWDRQSLIWACSCSSEEKLVLLFLNLYADENGECLVPKKVIGYRCCIPDIDRVFISLIKTPYLIVERDQFQILFETLKNEFISEGIS
jgi:hypothetical protein